MFSLESSMVWKDVDSFLNIRKLIPIWNLESKWVRDLEVLKPPAHTNLLQKRHKFINILYNLSSIQ